MRRVRSGSVAGGIAGLGVCLYVLLLLAISPCRSAASADLSHWPWRLDTTLTWAGETLFPTLPTLALAEKSVAPTKLEYWSKIVGIVDTVCKIVALLLGGLFAYWKFFMGRTFHPRLEPAITATARTQDDQIFLKVSCKLKNVGLSSIDLDSELSVIRVFLQDLAPTTGLGEVQWRIESDLAVDVFQSHDWIEGGETIEDAHLFVFPQVKNRACRVELLVFRTRRNLKERLREWRRRRKGPNAWAHHAILDEFTTEQSASDSETTKEKI